MIDGLMIAQHGRCARSERSREGKDTTDTTNPSGVTLISIEPDQRVRIIRRKVVERLPITLLDIGQESFVQPSLITKGLADVAEIRPGDDEGIAAILVDLFTQGQCKVLQGKPLPVRGEGVGQTLCTDNT